MKYKTGWILISIFTLVSLFAADITWAADEQDAVRKALDGFYSSLNAMFKGEAAAAKEVWSHTDDVAYMGADGNFNVGWEAMYADWEKQANFKLGGMVEISDVVITVGKDLAVTHQLVKSVNTKAAGVNKHAFLRASSVFRKEDGKWKMIGHHVDVIPELKREIMEEK